MIDVQEISCSTMALIGSLWLSILIIFMKLVLSMGMPKNAIE